MQRLLSTLLLALLVVGAQQAALVHEIGHGIGHGGAGSAHAVGTGLAHAAGAQGARDAGSGTTESGSYCDKCFQFAHVSGAGFSASPVLAFLNAGAQPAHGRPVAELAADAPQSRSRGPPITL